MSRLPEPTLLELQGYEYYHSVPKFVVKYKEFTIRDNKKHNKKTCHYGFFLDEKEAMEHFNSLPKYYSWKQDRYGREFVAVVKLEEMKADAKKKKKKEPRLTDHLNKRDPLVKQLIKDRFGKKN